MLQMSIAPTLTVNTCSRLIEPKSRFCMNADRSAIDNWRTHKLSLFPKIWDYLGSPARPLELQNNVPFPNACRMYWYSEPSPWSAFQSAWCIKTRWGNKKKYLGFTPKYQISHSMRDMNIMYHRITDIHFIQWPADSSFVVKLCNNTSSTRTKMETDILRIWNQSSGYSLNTVKAWK